MCLGRVGILESVETRSMYRFVAKLGKKEPVRVGEG
jgi:hypothetical protein